MKIYKDEELKDIAFELDFGRVEVGEEKIVSYWIYNDESCILERMSLEMENITSKEEVEILEMPKELRPFQKAELKVKWSPSLKIKAGLAVQAKINALKVWG